LLLAGVALVMLGVSACGGDASNPAAPTSSPTAAASSPDAAGPLDTNILNVSDGSITSLRQVITADRPVLLWFWAPF